MAPLHELPFTVAFVAILIGLGHSVLAMSGEETMAQVYREIEHPKLKNLEKAGFVIFVYSLIFTAGTAFFVVMIIPDAVRSTFFDNPIGGLAMHLAGPLPLRIAFRAFVAIVGTLMLAGAVNTSIVRSNGVLNRVSEDGILPHWFRHPHRRFGPPTGSSIRRRPADADDSGEWWQHHHPWRGVHVRRHVEFALKGLAVLVLRYKQPGAREFRVPVNVKIGWMEVPLGLALVTAMLFALCIINLFTKQVATISGVTFTLVFFAIFTISERTTRKRASAQAGLDQFNLEPGDALTPEAFAVRPGCVLVRVRNYNTLYNLRAVLDRVDTREQQWLSCTFAFFSAPAEATRAVARTVVQPGRAETVHACTGGV